MGRCFSFLICAVVCLVGELHPGLGDSLRTVERWERGPEPHSPPAASCKVSPLSRLDCYPDEQTDPSKCAARNCCWAPAEGALRLTGTPWCFFPSAASAGYSVTSRKDTQLGFSAVLKRADPSGWPNDVTTLQLDVMYEEATRLHFKIYDPAHSRYKVPIDTPKVTSKAASTGYTVNLTPSPFSIQVKRASSDTVLFDSSKTPLIFADQLIQIGSALPTNSIYGLGEHRQPFMMNASRTTRLAFWARDQPPTTNTNLYGDHAFFLGMEANGTAFGLFLLNSNAKEVVIGNNNGPGLTYTTIGGILDFYIFTGPSPDDVIQQYSNVIGHTFMPPYWSLGFHLCRWGYGGVQGLKKVIDRMRAAGMPYDTQWTDIDYMDKHLDWTYDKTNYSSLPEVVADLHSHGQHYVIIIDPGISSTQPAGTYPPYDEGIQDGVFIMTEDLSAPIIGKVWPGETAYPDFTNPKTVDYWSRMAKDFHDVLPFDGLWTDMNEPSNFLFGSTKGCSKTSSYDNPPYTPGIATGRLPDRTLCPSARQHLSQHYNLHSMYGHFEGIATNRALTNIRQKRSLVITRSSFPSSGRYMGHWTGDNVADWQNLYYSIPAILNFNMFGIPLVGADICGFSGDTTEELCTRWMQLGAFYPFMRNHNVLAAKDQDPAVFSPKAQDAMRNVLNLRYSLLPYLYTLFYHSHMNGTMVARPLFFEYPGDPSTYAIDKQFLWGSGLLVSPVLEQGKTSVRAYLPRGPWYDIFSGRLVSGSGSWITLDAPLSKINVHVKGGTIIPTQMPAITTTKSRTQYFGLTVALNESDQATGDLFWDDGDTVDTIKGGKFNLIQFEAMPGKVTSLVIRAGYPKIALMFMDAFTGFGVTDQPSKVIVNGQAWRFQYDNDNKVLRLTGLVIRLLSPFTITWS